MKLFVSAKLANILEMLVLKREILCKEAEPTDSASLFL
jgi:hypothetical protein